MDPMLLTDLEAVEVSLVDHAANKRRFLLLKNDKGRAGDNGPGKDASSHLSEGGEGMNKVLKALLETEAEDEKSLLKQMLTDDDGDPIDVSDEAQEALTAAVRLLLAYQDELPGELVAALFALVDDDNDDGDNDGDDGDNDNDDGNVEQRNTEGAKEGETVTKQDATKVDPASLVPVKKDDGTYDFSAIPEAVRPVIEALWKENEAAVTKAKELEATLKAERDERLTREFVAKAAALKNLSLNADEMGPVFKTLSESAPDAWAKIEGLLKTANQQLSQTALFREIGTSGGASAGSAWGRAVQMAEQMVQKSDNGMTKEQAITKVLQQNPDLYNEYLNERSSGVN